MQTTVLLTIAIAATMVLGVVPAYASQGNSDNSKNDFGEQASQDLATDKADDGRSEMGEHSSNPEPDLDPSSPSREGLGNVFNQGNPNEDGPDDPIGTDPNPGEPDSKHPSDLANRLCGAFPTNDACVDEDD